MSRIKVSSNLSETTKNVLKWKAEKLHLSVNGCSEAITMSKLLGSGYPFSETELDILIEDFIPNNDSSFTTEFKNYHKNLSVQAKEYFLKFLYEVSLINRVRISAVKQANFFKQRENGAEEYLFYYSIYKMRGIDIDEFVSNSGFNISTIGIQNQPSNEYLYIAKKQQFNQPTNVSGVFMNICTTLAISNAISIDCIKIHYCELGKLVDIINII